MTRQVRSQLLKATPNDNSAFGHRQLAAAERWHETIMTLPYAGQRSSRNSPGRELYRERGAARHVTAALDRDPRHAEQSRTRTYSRGPRRSHRVGAAAALFKGPRAGSAASLRCVRRRARARCDGARATRQRVAADLRGSSGAERERMAAALARAQTKCLQKAARLAAGPDCFL